MDNPHKIDVALTPNRAGGIIGSIHRSDFFRGVSVLMGGTIIAQLIPLLVLPILSRLYTPESFAVVALVMLAASLTGPSSTGYYEQAIPSPRNMQRARALALVAFLLTIASTSFVILVITQFQETIAQTFSLAPQGVWRIAIPIALGFGSSANIANFWLLRMGCHGLQSGIKLVHASSNALIAIALGYLHAEDGLLIGFMSAVALSALCGGYWSYRHGFRMPRVPLKTYAWQLMRHYHNYPLFGSIPATMNNLALQWPLLLITAHYSLNVAGHFSIIRNLLTGGIVLVSLCISQVLRKHLAQRIHAGLALWPLVKKVMLVVATLGIIGATTLYWAAPSFVAVYLGQGWEDSGAILRTLAISSPLIVIGTTLAPALIAIGRIRIMGLWQLFYLVVSLGLLLEVNLPFAQFLNLLVAMECVVYALYIPLICYHVRRFDAASVARA